MRRPLEIEKEKQTMASIVQLTGAFEGIASANIARIKNQVESSEAFFKELWPIYTRLRVSKKFHHGRVSLKPLIDKELVIIVTAEGSLSGDIDMRLIDLMLKNHNPAHQDIIAIGHHGASLLRQRKVAIRSVFELPEHSESLNIEAILSEVQAYTSTRVYYQAYVSLMNQVIKDITLSAAVEEMGESSVEPQDKGAYISDTNYIFEPSVAEVISHMELSMLGVALSEVVLESRLAQQASRFRAMTTARSRAKDAQQELIRQYNHAGRALKDERTREIINSLRKRTIQI